MDRHSEKQINFLLIKNKLQLLITRENVRCKPGWEDDQPGDFTNVKFLRTMRTRSSSLIGLNKKSRPNKKWPVF